MDFFDENGTSWQVLRVLCDNAADYYGETEVKIALLLWMLKLSSSEMKIYPVRRHLAVMLQWVVGNPNPGLEQASNLLLTLGGADLIDATPFHTDGYTVLQETVGYAEDFRGLCTLLSKGPDLDRRSVDHDFTPQEESPTSLSMYSSWAFWNWQDALASIQVDIEEFVEQELERNYAVHAGWKKETLLNLFAYGDRLDLDFRYSCLRNSFHRYDCHQRSWTCSDCSGRIKYIKVKPYWRHLMERIKQGLDPDSPAQAGSEVGEGKDAGFRSIAEAASSSSDVSLVDLNEVSSDLEDDPHGYPETVSIRSECVYAQHEVICMDCWLHYRQNGTRRPPCNWDRRSATDTDEDSTLDEYSPYLIHS